MFLWARRKIEWIFDNPFENFSLNVWKFFAQSPNVIIKFSFFLQKKTIWRQNVPLDK